MDINEKRNIKMIVFDLDGTLLDSNKVLRERTRKAMAAAIEQGVILLPATGRTRMGLAKEVREFPGIRYAITTNGAKIYKDDEVIITQLLPREKAVEIFKVFREYDAMREVCFDGKGYAEEAAFSKLKEYVPHDAMRAYVEKSRIWTDQVDEYLKTREEGFDKVQAFFKTIAEREEAKEKLMKIPGLEVTGAAPEIIEIMTEGVNKGASILKLAEYLGIKREETMAFGDGGNDITMLQLAGVGVAMGNAIPEAKAAADLITDTNDEDGVAKAIETYVLK